jgi:hypothetical protein
LGKQQDEIKVGDFVRVGTNPGLGVFRARVMFLGWVWMVEHRVDPDGEKPKQKIVRTSILKKDSFMNAVRNAINREAA